MRLTFDEHVADAAHAYLADLMRATDNNITRAAAIAGRNRTAFYRLLLKYEVSVTREVPSRRGNRGNREWRALGP